MAPEKRVPSISQVNNRLAKAETVLLLALILEGLINPWLYTQPQLPYWARAAIKMCIVVGSFGPIFEGIKYLIDRGLGATRTVTSGVLSLPKIMFHLLVMSVLFVAFYWHINKMLPWSHLLPARDRTVYQVRN